MTGQELKKIRIQMKLSQQKMAEFLGIKNGRTIRYYESGQTKIPDTVVKILKLIEDK